jgi:hypothetical protein
MIRAFVVFEEKPDEARYAEHLEFVRKVPGATFRHGRVFGVPMGEKRFEYYAEFEWPDMEAFKQSTASPEFMETGKDAMEMGVPFHVHFAEVS